MTILLVVFPAQRCWQSGGTPALGVGRVVGVQALEAPKGLQHDS